MSFFAALRYDIEAVCKTPLRTGAASGTVEDILRRADGTAILQASSLAGALRDWSCNRLTADETERLFGSQRKEGALIFSDVVFDANCVQSLRPRLKIDGATGTAENKYDVAALCSGSVGRFTILWTGANADESTVAQQHIEAMLSAINDGRIVFGAQKTNGFGRLTLQVKKRPFMLTKPTDRHAWLEEREATDTCVLPTVADDAYTVFTVHASAPSFLTKHKVEGHITYNLYESNAPILSGASVKGAVHARVSAIIATGAFAVNEADVNRWFGCSAHDSVSGEATAGTIIFSDVKLNPSATIHPIARIKLNRFTAGVMNRSLFSEAPIASDMEIRILVPADQQAACAMVLFALRDLGLGLYSLGSGHAIGRGYIDIKSIEAVVPNHTDPVVMRFEEGVSFALGASIADEWLAALGGR